MMVASLEGGQCGILFLVWGQFVVSPSFRATPQAPAWAVVHAPVADSCRDILLRSAVV
jgi:hypothetical protein